MRGMVVGGRWLRALAASAALATLALSLASVAAAGTGDQCPCGGLAHRAAPHGPLTNTGGWITDARGRVVILHGLNMVYKLPPYAPRAVGFGADDAGFLRRNGFNTVRLGMIDKAVEPQPGHYDAAYIDGIRSTERMLAAQGIFSLLDFHQDLYNEKFGGEGFPDWAVLDDGLPADPLTGFPYSYLTSPGLNRAFDNLWANDPGPGRGRNPEPLCGGLGAGRDPLPARGRSDGLRPAERALAGQRRRELRQHRGLPDLRHGQARPLLQRVISRIRAVERRHLVFYEPNVLFNFGADTNLPDLGFTRLGFSFHDYCLLGLVSGGPSTCGEAQETSSTTPTRMPTRPATRSSSPSTALRRPLHPEADHRLRRPAHGLLAGVALLRMRRPDDERPRGHPGAGQGSGSATTGLERVPRQAEGTRPGLPAGDRGHPDPILLRSRQSPFRAGLYASPGERSWPL